MLQLTRHRTAVISLIHSMLCRYVDESRLLGQNRSSPDLWLIDFRLFIFVDGESHFKTTHDVELKLQCERDQLANDQSKALGFHVLRLSYADINNFRQEIESMISMIQVWEECHAPLFQRSSNYKMPLWEEEDESDSEECTATQRDVSPKPSQHEHWHEFINDGIIPDSESE